MRNCRKHKLIKKTVKHELLQVELLIQEHQQTDEHRIENIEMKTSIDL